MLNRPKRAASIGRPLLSQDDSQLFREAVKDATPLRVPARRAPPLVVAPPIPVQTILDEYEALRETLARPITADVALDTGEEACYVRSGVSPLLLRKMRRGHWVVQAELDLHGATQLTAREFLGDFLRQSLRRGHRCVRVIHGKGLGSKNHEPVLKGRVKLWLAQRDEVLAFCQAPATQGGGGALLVLLKAERAFS